MPTTYQDISRHTSNVILDPEISSEIWAKAIGESVFMQLANRMTIPGSGVKVQTITGEPTADWVAETNPKPVSFHTFGNKTITPYKMAVIEPFSDEFRRDKSALYAECVRRLPGAIAKKFDATIMGNTAPGSGFDVLGTGVSSHSIIASGSTTVYDQFVDIDAAISEHDGILNAIALAPQGKSIVLGATDTTGHPLFTAGVGSNTVGSILGASVAVAKGVYVAGTAGTTPATVGVAGDFTGVRWGMVESIKMAISDQATLTYNDGSDHTLNLWQMNMFAVKVECEVAFAVMDKSQLLLLTGNTPAATTTTTTGA